MQKFKERISEVREKYNATGHKHHLTRMRNIRLKFGTRIKGADKNASPPEKIAVPNPFPEIKNAIPEIAYSELTPEVLAGAIQHHGALIIRNFLKPKDTAVLRQGIDETFEESKKFFSGKGQPPKDDPIWKSQWFRPDLPVPGYFKIGAVNMMLNTGSVWTFLSPTVSHQLLEIFQKAKLKNFLRNYFGGKPCVSFNKSVLRRMDPIQSPADWHQDGAFMTTAIKSINLWVALSDCGPETDSPGMDFIPKRFDEIVKTGQEDARFDWSVSPNSVKKWFKDTPVVSPEFKDGDAIFFDHYNLHATSFSPKFTRTRYAIETWFFPEEFAAKNQYPIAW